MSLGNPQVLMSVKRYKLEYYPLPKERRGREYVIGEAFLKYKGITLDELSSLRSVSDDPPDLIFNRKDYGQLRIEVTEAVPHDRGAIVQAGRFLKDLRGCLNRLGTRPEKPLNICISRDQFSMPKVKGKEIVDIAKWINDYCKQPKSCKVNTRIHDDTTPFKIEISIIASSDQYKYKIGNPPISISIIPAIDAFKYPISWYQNNLFLQDTTVFPIDYDEIKKCIDARIKKKGVVNYPADILIIYAIMGMLGSQGISEEIRNSLLCGLSFSGIYVLQIMQGKNDYFVNVTDVKKHSQFEFSNCGEG